MGGGQLYERRWTTFISISPRWNSARALQPHEDERLPSQDEG